MSESGQTDRKDTDAISPGIIRDGQIAVRNAGLLAVQRGAHVIGGLVFAVVIPRLMGPETYGRYALITSISLWFALFSGLSAAQVMGRFVPQIKIEQGTEGVQRLLGSLLAVRMTNGLLAAAAYLLLTALWFQELDIMVLAIIAGMVFLRAGSKLLFALFLGLNQAARWGLGEVIRRWASLALTVPGFYFGGLRGACLGLLLAEAAVLVSGSLWAGPYLSWSHLKFDRSYVAPYLRFGALFFASNLTLAASQRTGEMMVRLVTGDYIQVGYFGVAYRSYLTISQAFWQLTMSFTPLLIILLSQGRIDELRQWVERLLKWMSVSGVLMIYGVLFLAEDIIPLAIGEAYRPVATNLLPLALALPAVALSGVGRLLALTYHSPGIAFKASAIHLTSLWAIGIPLVTGGGSFAACLAVLAASVIHAGYYTWQMHRSMKYSLKTWAIALLAGAAFAPMLLIRGGLILNLVLYACFVLGYGLMMMATKTITPKELGAVRQALRPGRISVE